MTSYIFLAFFVSSCPISNFFYQCHIPQLQEELKKMTDIESHVEVITQASDIRLMNYPYDLENYLRWSPIFFLIPKKSWDRCCKDKERKLKINIFNGSFIEGNQRKIKPISSENIVRWIRETIEEKDD